MNPFPAIAKILSPVITVLMLVIFATHAQAEDTPVCAGKDLLKELQTSNPDAAAQIEKQAASIPNAGPILWKITPPNKAKPSWLMGTIHATDDRVTTLSDDLKNKIADSKVVILELKEVANKQALAATILGKPQFTMLPAGQKLWDVVPDDKEDEIRKNPVLKQVPIEILERFQPWILGTQLAMPACEVARTQHKFTLDQAIAQRAQISSVPIEGLEKIDEQLGAMSGLPMELQVRMLVASATMKIPAADTFQTTVELYLRHDVEALLPLMIELAGKDGSWSPADMEDFNNALLTKRNVTMADRAAPFLDKGQAFIAVGALHLAGEGGVVELLRKKGYKVEAGE